MKTTFTALESETLLQNATNRTLFLKLETDLDKNETETSYVVSRVGENENTYNFYNDYKEALAEYNKEFN